MQPATSPPLQAAPSPYDRVEQILMAEQGVPSRDALLPVLIQLTPRTCMAPMEVVLALGGKQAPTPNAAPVFQSLRVVSPDLTHLLATVHNRHAAPTAAQCAWLGRVIVYLRIDPTTPTPDAALAWLRSQARQGAQALFDILWVGPLLTYGLDLDAAGAAPPLDPPTTPIPGGAPVLAMIDDGFGYANAAFRSGDTPSPVSRIEALWMLHRPRPGDAAPTMGLHPLTGAEIDERLAALMTGTLTEAQLYARDTAQRYPEAAQHPTHRAVSHGTHMLGLAARQMSPAPGTRDLMAVQLPPFSLRDTNGNYLSFFAFLGARLILRRLLETAAPLVRPVVFNLSLGMVAGAKDGSGDFQREFLAEIEAYKAATGGHVAAFFAFGNARQSRQVAQLAPLKTHQTLRWVVQPQDRSACFMELRADGPFEIALTHPTSGEQTPFVAPRPGECQTLVGPDRQVWGWAVGQISARYAKGSLSFTPDGITVALRPTHPDLGHSAGAHGTWGVTVKPGPGTTGATAQIQSGSTPPGYAAYGRQSYFAYPAPGQPDPVTDRGSFSALAPISGTGMFTVGAARFGGAQPMPYSSSGGLFGIDAPSLSVVIEDRFMGGAPLGPGTLSGTTARLGGTSAAAALAAGAYAQGLSKGTDPTQPPNNTAHVAQLGRRVIDPLRQG